MRRQGLAVIGFVAAVLLVVAANTFYVVDQVHQAIVLRLGEPVRVVNADRRDPGLKVKVPFVERVVTFDNRVLDLEADEEEVITSNQERLVVDAFVRYRIKNPLQFYTAVRDENTARDRLQRLVTSSLRQQLGSTTTNQIISDQRAPLMMRVRDDVARRAAASRIGVEIVDLRIKRADLPEANMAAVYKRMQTARQQEAAQIRAQGEQQRKEIVATATNEAERIRGEGDAERARIFAQSFGKDPAFANFYRSMKAYETAMANGDTTMVLSPDSDFFKYFKNGPGR